MYIQSFKHGDKVRLETNGSAEDKVGTLHLPDTGGIRHTRVMGKPAVVPYTTKQFSGAGVYKIHTIILENGHKFRSEGRLRTISNEVPVEPILAAPRGTMEAPMSFLKQAARLVRFG